MKIGFIVTILSAMVSMSGAWAIDQTNEKQCQSEIRKCFSEEGAKKTNCFYRITQSNECKETETGKLAGKRWTMSGTQLPEGANAFLGHSSVEASCLTSCDNQWFAFIVAAEPANDTSSHVSTCLDACKVDSKLEIIRP